MFACPNCHDRMLRVKAQQGIFWGCPTCGGRAATLPVLRKTVDNTYLKQLWLDARGHENRGDRPCPTCQRAMAAVRPAPEAPELDVCGLCHLVWFDPKEFERLPEQPPEPAEPEERELPQEARELIARHQIKRIAEQARRSGGLEQPPDVWWKYGLALFGVPVEAESQELQRLPLATWILAGLIVAVSVLAFSGDTESIIKEFGLIPSELGRYGGLTFVTSFFLHGGIIHLLGNVYFLIVFGDNVEDHLGKGWYLVLIAVAALAGDLLHIAVEPGGEIPSVGASGGISGVILFYALAFPRARLGFFIRLYFYFKWITLPAMVYVIFWILLQLFGVYAQLAGFSNVNALAHLGGAAVGFVFWLAKGR